MPNNLLRRYYWSWLTVAVILSPVTATFLLSFSSVSPRVPTRWTATITPATIHSTTATTATTTTTTTAATPMCSSTSAVHTPWSTVVHLKSRLFLLYETYSRSRIFF